VEATLRVGLPGWLIADRQKSWATALDVTALIDEWALALLDPIDALRRAARQHSNSRAGSYAVERR
jgi:hypothetical protein